MTAPDIIAAVRAACRKYPSARRLTNAREAQSEASKAAKAASKILVRELPALSSEERISVVFEAVREINRAALDAAEKMQRTRAEKYGEQNLGTARPEFDAERARHLATYADSIYADGEPTSEQTDALEQTIENNSRLCVDDAERELADARYNMGCKAYIVRTAMGANTCDWCLEVAGEYEYGPTMDKGAAFGRHNNCDCIIEYHPGTGKTETVRNYRTPEKDRARLRNRG